MHLKQKQTQQFVWIVLFKRLAYFYEYFELNLSKFVKRFFQNEKMEKEEKYFIYNLPCCGFCQFQSQMEDKILK